MNIKVIDLFCGAGGLTHGLKLAGLDVVAGYDIESDCKFAYEHNNNSLFFNKDVALLTKKEILDLYNDTSVKILAGCAPCQPFSTYTQGKNKEKDKKWPLLYQFERLIRETTPEIVTMENVPDVTKHKVYDDFYNSLKKMGYFMWSGNVNCVEYGIPQQRVRHVLLASKFGEISFIPPKNEKIMTVKDAIYHLPKIKDGQIYTSDPLHRASKLTKINKRRILYSKPGGSWKDWPSELLLECHKKETGKNYGSVYGRMEWDKPSPTITTLCYGFGNGRFGHPSQNRALSLREAALLQTFPSDYKFTDSSTPIRMKNVGKMIGNAVPVKLGEAIGHSISNHIKLFNIKECDE